MPPVIVTQISGERTTSEIPYQYIQFDKKGKPMTVQQFLEYFRQLPQSTQVAVIVGILILIVGVAVFPAAGTNLITFLLGLKMLIGR